MNLLISVTTVRKALTSISKHWLLYVIKIGVAVLVMTVLITVIKPVVIYQAVIQANQLFVFLACLLVFPNLYVQFKKWRYLVCLVKPDVTHSDVWRSLLIGFTFGFITPGRIGEYGRAFFIKDSSWERILGVTILDKLFSMSIIAIMGGLGLIFIWENEISTQNLYLRLLLIGSLIGLVLLFLLSPDRVSKILCNSKLASTHPKLNLLFSSLDQFHRKQALFLLGWCVTFFMTYTVQLFILILAFEKISPLQSFAASSSAMLVKTLLPISLGDIGIRESASVYFYAKMGISKATAFDASFILFILNILFPSLVGLVILLRDRLNGKKRLQSGLS